MWNDSDIKILGACAIDRLFYDMANAEIYRNNPEGNYEELNKLIIPQVRNLTYEIWNESGNPFTVLNNYIDKVDKIIKNAKNEVQKAKKES